MYPSLFFAFDDFPLKDYKGGENPIIAILIMVIIFFSLFSAISYMVWRVYLVVKFNNLCAISRLTRIEINVLKRFLRKFNIDQPLAVISNRSRFDLFMNSVAHYYEQENLSEEEIIEKVFQFHQIRKKLRFMHSFKSKKITSSRVVPLEHSLHIVYLDHETNNIFEFTSQVVDNHDFYLGIEPPAAQLNQQMFDQDRVTIEVTFNRDDDTEYIFDTQLVRLVNYPKIMWYVRHSKSLRKGDPNKSLEIPGTVLIQTLDETNPRIDEFTMMIDSLTNKGCALYLTNKKTKKLQIEANILISFQVDQSPLTVRAHVISSLQKGPYHLYRCNFHDLSKEDRDCILRFISKKKKEMHKMVEG